MMVPSSTDAHNAHGGSGKGALVGILAAAPLAVATAFFALQLPAVIDGETLRISAEWVSSLNVNLSFRLDGLSMVFALLISAIGAVVALYSSAYLAGHSQLGRYYLYLLSFTAAMLGLVLSDNLITLFVFWELTTITSYLLVGFNHESSAARRAALQALLITGGGGLALLAGIVLLGIAAGSLELSEIATKRDLLHNHALYLPILALCLLGAFTKSAQVPFHFWLPNAMAAPTPISAFLHSATMVKAGVYLLARLYPALGGTDAWLWSLSIFGAATAVLGGVLAIRQTDLKKLLAYTTVMALGTLVMFLGSQATVAIAAAMTFLIVHSLYKASLFMVAGIIDHQTGTRDLGKLGGLAAAMPATALAAAMAAFSMGGFPPFLGFIGKELKYEGALAIASEPWLVAAAAVFANAFVVAAAIIAAVHPFLRKRKTTPIAPREAPLTMWIGPLVLAALGLAFGVAPGPIGEFFVDTAVSAITARPETIKLSLWHGINVPLLLSVLTFALGVAIYLSRRPLIAAIGWMGAQVPSSDVIWDRLIDELKALAAAQTNFLQSGQLTSYLRVTVAVLVGVVGGTVLLKGTVQVPEFVDDLNLAGIAVVAVIAAAAVTAAIAQTRLTGLCALGVVGVGVALIFVMMGAPDLAITQLLVDTLGVVLVVGLVIYMPGFADFIEKGQKTRRLDALLGILLGTVFSMLLLAVVSEPFNRRISAFYETAAFPEGHGRNIVNVILVDFRAFDTFGEVAVIIIAAIAAYALLVGARARKERE